MGSLLIRRLDDSIKARLRTRAARRGRSMEEEAREILKVALARAPKSRGGLAEEIHARFAALGGFDMPSIPRDPVREPPRFE